MRSRKKRFLTSFGLTVGILSGAVTAYFLAPKKGKDTQRMLVKHGNKIAQKSIVKIQEGLIQFEIALADNDQTDFR